MMPRFKILKIFISRDVTFNESTMLSPRKEQLDAKNNLDMRENMEFKPKALRATEKMILIKPKEEEVQHLDNKENTP